MVRIIISSMVIFLMYKWGTAFFPIKFLNMNIISWSNKIFNEETLYGNKFDFISLIKLKKMLNDVDRISHDFDAISNKMNQTQSKRMPVHVDDSNPDLSCLFFKESCKKQFPDQSQILILHEYISTVNNSYTDIRNKLIKAQTNYKSLNDSMSHILDKTKSLSITLEKIYQLILPTKYRSMKNFLDLTITNANVSSSNKY